jgi:hypothetical protein
VTGARSSPATATARAIGQDLALVEVVVVGEPMLVAVAVDGADGGRWNRWPAEVRAAIAEARLGRITLALANRAGARVDRLSVVVTGPPGVDVAPSPLVVGAVPDALPTAVGDVHACVPPRFAGTMLELRWEARLADERIAGSGAVRVPVDQRVARAELPERPQP